MKTTIYSIVHKNIGLMTGESLRDFSVSLTNAVREHFQKKLNLPSSRSGKVDWSVYPVEIFNKSLVASAYSYNESSGGKSDYYAVSYFRNKDGSFDLGDLVKVERFVGFREVSSSTKVSKNYPVTCGDSAFDRQQIEKAVGNPSVQKAPMSAASTNDLPDAAFAVISSGGKKDASGKTVPRSLRHLPHHTSAVKNPDDNNSIDVPRLRNALARLSQTQLSSEDMARAKAHLEKHAKAVLASRGGNPSRVKKSSEIVNVLDLILENEAVAKSIDGSLWIALCN